VKRAIVIGAGMSGLAAAYRLQQAGLAVTVLEATNRAGGQASTEYRDGYLIDTGPDLINASFVRYLNLVREVGLGDNIVSCSQVVDVLRDGRAVAVDRKRPLSLVTNPVLSLRGKLALARGYLRLRAQIRGLDPYALTGHAAADHGTAHDLCIRHFNDEVTEQLVDPILRAFAGTGTRNASGLSVLAAFAVGTKKMFAIKGGMASVTEELARRVDVRCEVQVLSVDDTESGVTVRYRHDETEVGLDAEVCVLAVPYREAVSIWPVLRKAGGEFGQSLKDVPLMSISVGYAAPSPTLAYSVLVPSNESEDALLVMMQQNKAPDRAPDGKTLVTVFTEAAVTAQMMQRSDDELVDWASKFIESYYPSLAGHRELGTVARWPHTGYWPSPGYWQGIKAMRTRLPKLGVHVTSTLFGSGGIERAVLGGERAASRILRR
jgi:protoporphyrinogen/coproporphyrinogen III oxidase